MKECECGGIFQERTQDFQGIQTKVMVCSICGKINLTKEQAERLAHLTHLQTIVSGRRKIIKVGNSLALTLPHTVKQLGLKEGSEIELKLVEEKKLLLLWE